MAPRFVVLDDKARRAEVVKTADITHVKHVRDKACEKLGIDKRMWRDYLLKYEKKTLDPFKPLQIENIAQGARLTLVKGSSSPTPVTVRLQLPAAENDERLTLKFPRNTSLWQIMRVFESTPPKGAKKEKYNFTERASPSSASAATTAGTPTEAEGKVVSGSGRLYYEEPVIVILDAVGKEFERLSKLDLDLQTTLEQRELSGNVSLRLEYKPTDEPFETAVQRIDDFFKQTESQQPLKPVTNITEQLSAVDSGASASRMAATEPMEGVVQELAENKEVTVAEVETQSIAPESAVTIDQQPVVIYAPPSASTPQAAAQPHHEADYELNIDQAKRYQNQIADLAKNKRLPSDAEIAAEQEAKLQKQSAITELRLRIRAPDQSQIDRKFSPRATTAEVFTFVRQLLEHGDQPFHLKFTTTDKNGRVVQTSLPDSNQTLGEALKFSAMTLLVASWHDSVPMTIRKAPSLKKEYISQAQDLKVHLNQQASAAQTTDGPSDAKGATPDKGKAKMSGAEKESKLKNILGKGLFKKK